MLRHGRKLTASFPRPRGLLASFPVGLLVNELGSPQGRICDLDLFVQRKRVLGQNFLTGSPQYAILEPWLSIKSYPNNLWPCTRPSGSDKVHTAMNATTQQFTLTDEEKREKEILEKIFVPGSLMTVVVRILKFYIEDTAEYDNTLTLKVFHPVRDSVLTVMSTEFKRINTFSTRTLVMKVQMLHEGKVIEAEHSVGYWISIMFDTGALDVFHRGEKVDLNQYRQHVGKDSV